jgi:hypothetical protein
MVEAVRRLGGARLAWLRSLPLLAIMLIAGCSQSTTPSTRPTPTATQAHPPGSYIEMAAAWGQRDVREVPTALDPTHVFVFQNATASAGRALVGTIVPRAFIANTTELSVLALYDIETRHITRLSPLLRPQSQIIRASADDTWIVWSEAPDQPNFFDWTLFAYNFTTGQTKKLAEAPRQNGQAVPGPSPMPVVDHGYAIWGQAIATVDAQNIQNAVVRGLELSTGKITTLATKAGAPVALSWPWAAWSQITSGSTGYETLRNLSSGQETHVKAQAAWMAMNGVSLAYNDTAAAYLVDDVAQAGPKPQPLPAGTVEFVSMNDRVVAGVKRAEDAEVWDRVEHLIVHLPTTHGNLQTWVGGHTLLWYDPVSAAEQEQDTRANLLPTPTLYVMDTSGLPTQPVA